MRKLSLHPGPTSTEDGHQTTPVERSQSKFSVARAERGKTSKGRSARFKHESRNGLRNDKWCPALESIENHASVH